MGMEEFWPKTLWFGEKIASPAALLNESLAAIDATHRDFYVGHLFVCECLCVCVGIFQHLLLSSYRTMDSGA